ncbi:helix-turn-helix domain-containing protein [Bradyrhizobium genosp. P]|uniref:helix-turn-helix domain-containing protein n=1 Tax=Bradyrhizobium genosp. P TaxID=83641 RepID=UPI003CFB71B5
MTHTVVEDLDGILDGVELVVVSHLHADHFDPVVVQARVSRARELLEATRIPIERVATETGFGSADAIRHHFRARLGTSPALYRATFQAPAP